jgi:hypothetical protein
MTATDIVRRFLEKRLPLVRSRDFPQVVYAGDEDFTSEFLTRWTWTEFQEVPSQSAVRNAYAVLHSLAEVRQ